MIIINKIKIVLNVENIRNVFAGKMIKYHYPYVSKYIYRTQDLAKVASFSDSKPQKQHYAKINGLEKLIINIIHQLHTIQVIQRMEKSLHLIQKI